MGYGLQCNNHPLAAGGLYKAGIVLSPEIRAHVGIDGDCGHHARLLWVKKEEFEEAVS